MQCIVTIRPWVGSSALLLYIQSVVYGPRYLVVLHGSPLVSEGVVMTYICVSGEGQDFWSSVPGQWSWGEVTCRNSRKLEPATHWDCPLLTPRVLALIVPRVPALIVPGVLSQGCVWAICNCVACLDKILQ